MIKTLNKATINNTTGMPESFPGVATVSYQSDAFLEKSSNKYLRILINSLLLICLILLGGCRGAQVYNINQAAITSSDASQREIQAAIVRGAKKAGWTPKVVSANQVMATYSYKRDKFGATVIIGHDRNTYSINYHDSRNLKYRIKQNGEQSVATIHKIYNKWVTLLNQKINQELKTLAISPSGAYAGSTRNGYKPKPTKPVTQHCYDQPDQTISGIATISKSSVNLRSGAGTHCGIVGTVGAGREFSLLGRKNNWYYIDTGDARAWVYAPLVKRISETRTYEATESVEPPPAVPPSKRISIAVIRFKTLNKEAQQIALGELVSETFTSALVNSRSFKIIEREQLDKVVKEIEMNQTGFIETTDAVEIGKILHADAIITGSVALLGGQIQLNARIIEVESAYVISADTRTTNYTLSNITQIANEIVRKLSNKLVDARRK